MAPIIKKTTTRSTSSVMVRKVGEMPWRAKLGGERGHVWRYANNPIIAHDALSYSNSIFNSAVVPFKGGYAGVFRCDDTELKRTMNVGFSDDGIHWQIDEKPIEFLATKKGMPQCCQPYDPRITEIDGRYYITWCNVYYGPTLGFGYTDDFKTFHLLEPISTPYNRNGVLFPRKVNGKYALLSRPSGNGHCTYGSIFYSESPDLEHWGCHRFVAGPEPGWQDCKIGAGPPPIETPYGWLLFYHGVKSSCSGLVYRMGVMLLDLDEPSKVISKSTAAVLSPEASYERMGDVPNVIFPCAALYDKGSGKIALYYGAADTTTCLAFTTLDEIMAAMQG